MYLWLFKLWNKWQYHCLILYCIKNDHKGLRNTFDRGANLLTVKTQKYYTYFEQTFVPFECVDSKWQAEVKTSLFTLRYKDFCELCFEIRQFSRCVSSLVNAVLMSQRQSGMEADLHTQVGTSAATEQEAAGNIWWIYCWKRESQWFTSFSA